MNSLRDVVFGRRQFCRHSWMPIAIVVSLGAAMGIGTSLFSIVSATWLAEWRVPQRGTGSIDVVRTVMASAALVVARGFLVG